MDILNGLRVIELASVLAGPSVGQFLAECGAEVIKIENAKTKGDVTRSWKLPSEDCESSISAYFSCANWGKKSLCLQLPEDIEKLKSLAANSDIVIASYKPGDAEKLKTDYESLKAVNPKLIYGHITGYGNESDRVGYDAIIQAEAGFTFMNGEKNGNPVKMPVALVDLLAAHQLKAGILLALLRREKTGEGAYVHVSLFEAAVCSLANQATNFLCTGHIPQRIGSEHPNIVPYGTIYRVKDGAIVLAVGNDKQFRELCAVLGIPETAEDNRFTNNFERVKNREVLNQILSEAFLKFEKNKIFELLSERQVPAGLLRNMKEVFETPLAKGKVLSSGNFKGIRQIAFSIKNLPESLLFHPPYLSGNENLIKTDD
jgi:crotonobetainyl-CoA:carnitine CoA-transferase CaiB-like acyl-CoA transferase